MNHFSKIKSPFLLILLFLTLFFPEYSFALTSRECSTLNGQKFPSNATCPSGLPNTSGPLAAPYYTYQCCLKDPISETQKRCYNSSDEVIDCATATSAVSDSDCGTSFGGIAVSNTNACPDSNPYLIAPISSTAATTFNCCGSRTTPVVPSQVQQAGPQIAPAAPSTNPSFNYTLLEKIPGVDSQNLNLAAYLSAIYKLAIWIVGLCALFMFLVGAFMYMLSAANTSKMGSAKSIMQDALIGLVLALASYLILYVINPDLVNLKLPTVSMSSGAPEGTPNTAKTPGASWPNDSATRSELDTAGISFNKANCVTEGDKSSPCTSVAELGRAAIDGLKSLKTACTACHDSKNDIMVNGGTEYWFHSAGTSHQKGNSVVDLNRTPDLLAYIQQSGQVACSLGGRPVYRLNGADYWDEDDKHFHVSFGGKICK